MRVAVSACLLGVPCRYDGASKPNEPLMQALEAHDVLPICPEVDGGLSIPHPACEIVSGFGLDHDDEDVRVVNCIGEDCTGAFVNGAVKTLSAAREFNAELAILKAKSPSCGTGRVYDGTFSGTLREGWGVAARMLRDEGIACVDETKALDEIDARLSTTAHEE